MKIETKSKLFEAWAYCDWKDTSTEFMLTYMADLVDSWDESDVADWIFDLPEGARAEWYKNNPDWTKKYENSSPEN